MMKVQRIIRVFRSTDHVSQVAIENPRLLSTYLRSSHGYATQSSLGGSPTASRKQVTVINDDGRVEWTELTTKEKIARTTQQTFNLGLILTGVLMTVRPQFNNTT